MPFDPGRATVRQLADAYRRGVTTPVEATEVLLARIRPGPTWRVATADRARAQAARAQRAFEAGIDLGPLQGVPLAIKDLLDMEGEVSAAGSAGLLAEGRRAERDAPLIARLDAAGAVFLGRTQMTELAFSGLGLNPHAGTPEGVHAPGRVPGGSSSGSAVAVAAGEATAAIGSDTGGSVRIPAALQGLVGLKTSDGSLPLEGTVPLSTTLDTVGPIARSLEDAWIVLRALRAEAPAPFPVAPGRLRLLVPQSRLLEGLDEAVAAAFEAAVAALTAAGHEVVRRADPAPDEALSLYPRYGSFAAHEAFALHEAFLRRSSPPVDPRVGERIRAVAERPSSDYLRLRIARQALVRRTWERWLEVDAVLAPTVPIVAPRIADLEADDGAYRRANATVLRNTTVFNLLAGPAVTLPIAPPERGIGGMVATAPGREAQALAIAARWREALAD
jgi:aspartyl-tRNA(Asn)/glutamyl-tRNA(Gln) amidotransferase subunit A